jgi:hypothetical protein
VAVCASDADCVLVSDYCTGCDCRALGKGEAAPSCPGPGVRCFSDPCGGKAAVCAAGRCYVKGAEPASCATQIEGSETSCKSASEWKAIAYQLCKARGQELTAYSAGGGDCGNGNTRYVKYECCPAKPAPPPLPPPPPAPACFGEGQGGETSCKPPELWKQYAADACKARGAELSMIDYAVDCGGGNFRYIKYVCCPPTPPPGQCKADSDCPLIRIACKDCPSGQPSCPSSRCLAGQCQVVFPECPASPFNPCAGKACGESCRRCAPDDKGCVETPESKRCDFVSKCSSETSMCSTGANSCPTGLTWCFFSGHCVDARCACCDSEKAPPCKTADDCGPSCTKCSDGTLSCAEATCGERAPNQCFYQEPKCPGK